MVTWPSEWASHLVILAGKINGQWQPCNALAICLSILSEGKRLPSLFLGTLFKEKFC